MPMWYDRENDVLRKKTVFRQWQERNDQELNAQSCKKVDTISSIDSGLIECDESMNFSDPLSQKRNQEIKSFCREYIRRKINAANRKAPHGRARPRYRISPDCNDFQAEKPLYQGFDIIAQRDSS
jgi:hypothetical protein